MNTFLVLKEELMNHLADKKIKSLLQLSAIKYNPQLKEFYNKKEEQDKNKMLVIK
ncbi:MAG: hypothetical protein K2X95_01390 [Flavobacteriaceae bacterium]|nr:hypothetical protein [Flavobacteriaceae bacterium]